MALVLKHLSNQVQNIKHINKLFHNTGKLFNQPILEITPGYATSPRASKGETLGNA